MANMNVSIRMDEDVKKEADAMFAEMGMSLSGAFNVFVRQALRERAIPFKISLGQPNLQTVAAMLEAERIAKDPHATSYASAKELFAALDRDED